jgi:ribosome biogenesis protein Tsr3
VESRAYTRRCVIARLAELSAERFRDMVSQNAGALLVLLPTDLHQLSPEDKQVLPRSVVCVFSPIQG